MAYFIQEVSLCFFSNTRESRLADILIFISKNYYWDIKSLQVQIVNLQLMAKYDPMCGLYAEHVSLYLWVTTL